MCLGIHHIGTVFAYKLRDVVSIYNKGSFHDQTT